MLELKPIGNPRLDVAHVGKKEQSNINAGFRSGHKIIVGK